MMGSGKVVAGGTEAGLGRQKGIRPTEIEWKGRHILEGHILRRPGLGSLSVRLCESLVTNRMQ